MDQRTIKLLIVAFTVVGVIVVVVSFNIHAKLENSLTTNPGNCFFNPDTNRQFSSSYRVIKRNYEDSTESDNAEEDRIKMLCWTLNKNCYCFSTPTNKSYNWYEANQYCKGGSMALLSLENEDEDRLVYKHIKSTPALDSELYWTSGQHSLRWEWVDGKSINYTNWKTGKSDPNEEIKNEAYLYLDTSYDFESGYWFASNNSRLLQSSDNSSFSRPMSFICES